MTSETEGVSSTTQKFPARRNNGWRARYKIKRKIARKIRKINLKKMPPR